MLMNESKTLTGGDLWNHLSSRDERIERAQYLFDLVRKRKLTLEAFKYFRLSEGEEAHRLLESRKSTGKILLIP